MGDHTEAIEIDYDPSLLSYEDLLGAFVRSHDPCAGAWSVQYRSAVWVRSDEEERLATAALEKAGVARGLPVRTAVERMGTFYRAEDYHQKYRLRNSPAVLRSLMDIYPDEMAFTDSTAAARVNAYLGGDLSFTDLVRMLSEEGLEVVGEGRLESVRRRGS
jgi:hypothetical protein